MVKEMTGAERRKKILQLIKDASTPMSGSQLGKETGVSRQVVVQDIALLRTEGYDIVSTARGYIVNEPDQFVRLFKVCHTNEQIEDELNTIVDIGGEVIDVIVNHRVYGKVSGNLNIRSRRDVRTFVQDLQTGKSTPSLNITSGYHFHHVAADSEGILDEIEQALQEKHYLAERMPYEVEL